MLFIKLGFRNLFRNRRRTFLTMSAMISAVTLLIFILSMNEGLIWDMINNATETVHGHITVSEKTFFENPSLNKTISFDAQFRQNLLNDPNIKGICGRLSCFALLTFANKKSSHSQPAELVGVDPLEEKGVSRLFQCVASGVFIPESDSKTIVLGEGLAKRLDANVGGEVVIMGQGADGSMAADVLIISGIMKTGDTARDAVTAFVGRKALQGIFVLENRLHKWNIFLKYPLLSRALANDLRKKYADLAFTTWQSLLPQIAGVLSIWDAAQVITMFIFYFAVFLISINTMNMAFLERVREFAILGAIGLTKARISALLLLEGVFLSGFSGLIGGGLGSIIGFILRAHPISLSRFVSSVSYGGGSIQPVLSCQPTLFNTFMPIGSMFLLGIIVACIPVLKILRLRPIEALREA